jgi:hypothetical protein
MKTDARTSMYAYFYDNIDTDRIPKVDNVWIGLDGIEDGIGVRFSFMTLISRRHRWCGLVQ